MQVSGAMFVVSVFALGLRYVSRLSMHKNTCDTGWRLYGVPLKVRKAALSDIEAVRVVHRVHRNKYLTTSGSENPDHHYLVSLQGIGKGNIQLIRNKPEKARLLGEQLARYIQRPLYDGSHGRMIKRMPEELDMSLGQRLHYRGLKIKRPNAPTTTGVKQLGQGYGMQLVLPPGSLPKYVLWVVVAALALMTALAWFVLSVNKVLILLLVVPLGPYLIVSISSSYRPLYLWVGMSEVSYSRFPFRGSMKLQELEEVTLYGGAMALISDKKVMYLPYDFVEKEDGRYVRQLIEHMAYRAAAET